MNIRNSIKYLRWIFIVLAVLGASSVIQLAKYEHADLMPSLLVMGIGSAGMFILELHKWKTTPKAVRDQGRRVEKTWMGKGQFLEFDIGWVVFLTGIIAEYLSFDQLHQKLSAVVVYSILSYAIYIKCRKRITTYRWAFFFHLGFMLAMPYVSFAWQFPEFLSEIGLVDVYGSRRFSYLTFLYLQGGLIVSTVISASRSWRTTQLIKRKLSNRDLMITQRDFLLAVKDDKLRDFFHDVASDVPTLRETIITGDFGTAIGWGWSIVGRILDKLSPGGYALDKAKELNLLTTELKESYAIRNKTVHEGYRPNFDEACDFLMSMKQMLLSLGSGRRALN